MKHIIVNLKRFDIPKAYHGVSECEPSAYIEDVYKRQAQNSEIDGVSGATMTSNAVKAALKQALDQAMGVVSEQTALNDGRCV